MTTHTRQTNCPSRELDSFETELLTILRAEVRGRGAAKPLPAAPGSAAMPELPSRPAATLRPGSRRPRVGVAAAAAAAVTGLAFGLPMLAATPAYAILTSDSGDVTVSITRLEDSAGLEAALAAHGIKAKVDYLPAGQFCADGRYTEARTNGTLLLAIGQRVGADAPAMEVTVPKAAWNPEWTLVLAHSGDIRSQTGQVGVAAGAVAACRLVPAPHVGGGAPSGADVQPGQPPRSWSTP